ncbi:MAG: FAD-binding oxidoreductase [Acidobacteriota bacterium]
MSDKGLQLSKSIESVLGSENVTHPSELDIFGSSSVVLALPGSASEVAECLRICSSLKAAVIPAGSMSWLDCGNPVRRADLVLSLNRMSRVIDYSPPDLTVTVEAGLTLVDLNKLTSRERQWLPLDPPGGSVASLGAIAACNSSGPLRLGFGTPRDYVIGLKLAHADGTESKCGGRVVKNVAGYDMNKLYVGSYGTLAVITELTFKLRPLPESAATIVVTANRGASLFEFAKRVRTSELQPASIFLARRLIESRPEVDALLIRFVDNEAAVNHQVGWIKRAAYDDFEVRLLSEDEAEGDWRRLARVDRMAAHAVRISVPVSAIESVVGQVELESCAAAVDLGLGIIRITFDEDEDKAADTMKRMRKQAEESGGTLFVERTSAAVKQEAGAWGDGGAASSLMKSVKAKFDPESILSPGRFVAGI